MERKGGKIVLERGVRSFYKNGKLLQANFVNNSYVWKPAANTLRIQQLVETSYANDTNKFVLQTDALPSNLTDLWNFRLGH